MEPGIPIRYRVWVGGIDLLPPGGSCDPTLAARSPSTYLFFSRASKLGEYLHHATFYAMHLLMEQGHNQTSA